jgi:uncharacterized protein (DUF486 family)
MNLTSVLSTVLLLIVSNAFMTVAWYGHLRHKSSPLWWAILSSWGWAFFEYVFQVPANRLGSNSLSVTQLKIVQECITLVVFSALARLMFGETLRWNTVLAYLFVVVAVVFAVWDKL